MNQACRQPYDRVDRGIETQLAFTVELITETVQVHTIRGKAGGHGICNFGTFAAVVIQLLPHVVGGNRFIIF